MTIKNKNPYSQYFNDIQKSHKEVFLESQEVVISEFLSALINECCEDVTFTPFLDSEVNYSSTQSSLSPLGARSQYLTKVKTSIKHLKNKDRLIVFSAIGEIEILLGRVLFIKPDSLKIAYPESDQELIISDIDDLEVFGLDVEQLNKLKNTLKGTVSIALTNNQIRENQYRTVYIGLLEEKYRINFQGNLTLLIKSLPPSIVLASMDQCCGVDGAPNNPLRNAMGEPNSISTNCFQYHPTILSNSLGYLSIPLVHFGKDLTVHSFGDIPTSTDPLVLNLSKGLFPVHPYNLNELLEKYPNARQCGTMKANVTASKRTLIPLNSNLMLKLSLKMQLGSRQRVLHFQEIQNAIIHSKLLIGLAEKQRLPCKTWIMPDIFGMGIGTDTATTFMLRGGLAMIISNEVKGLPDHLTAIPGFALFTRNILSDRSLFQDLVDNGGFDPVELFKSIAKSLIYMQLEWICMGVIPESHGQNTLYILDLEKKSVEGLIIRDLESLDFTLEGLNYIQNITGLFHDGINDSNVHAGYLCEPGEEREHAMYDYSGSVLDKQLIPFSHHLFDSYGVSLEDIRFFLKETYIKFWLEKGISFREYSQLLPDAQVQRNLLRLGLHFDTKRVRNRMISLSSNSAIPNYEELKNKLTCR
jgi:hypothetical protein